MNQTTLTKLTKGLTDGVTKGKAMIGLGCDKNHRKNLEEIFVNIFSSLGDFHLPVLECRL